MNLLGRRYLIRGNQDLEMSGQHAHQPTDKESCAGSSRRHHDAGGTGLGHHFQRLVTDRRIFGLVDPAQVQRRAQPLIFDLEGQIEPAGSRLYQVQRVGVGAARSCLSLIVSVGNPFGRGPEVALIKRNVLAHVYQRVGQLGQTLLYRERTPRHRNWDAVVHPDATAASATGLALLTAGRVMK